MGGVINTNPHMGPTIPDGAPDTADVDVRVPHEHTESHQNPLKLPVTGGGGGNSGGEEDLHDDSNNDGSKKGTLQQQSLNQSLKGWKEVSTAVNNEQSSRSNDQVASGFSNLASMKAANQIKKDVKGPTGKATTPSSSSAEMSSTGETGNAVETDNAVEADNAVKTESAVKTGKTIETGNDVETDKAAAADAVMEGGLVKTE